MRSYSWYTFHTNHFTPVAPGSTTYRVMAFTVLARSLGAAYRKIEHRVPQGFKVFAWMKEENPARDFVCTLCGGPWSESTGHWEPEMGRVWCGRCARDMYAFLKSMLPRRLVFRSKLQNTKVGMRFYDYNSVPPEKPPPGWEP